MKASMKRQFLLAALALWSAACTNDIAAPRREALLSTDPSFARFNSSAYAVAEKSGSFWAVAGQTRSIALHFGDTGREFVRFTVGSGSLAARPDGSAFQPGDSIQINVTVANDGTVVFHFEPSGLRFNSNDPAELTIETDRTNVTILNLLSAGIVKRDALGLPWLTLPTLHLSDAVEADVDHFTDFGMAVN